MKNNKNESMYPRYSKITLKSILSKIKFLLFLPFFCLTNFLSKNNKFYFSSKKRGLLLAHFKIFIQIFAPVFVHFDENLGQFVSHQRTQSASYSNEYPTNVVRNHVNQVHHSYHFLSFFVS